MQLVQETAIVSYKKGDYVFLKTHSMSACGSCASKSACGSVSLFNSKSETELKVTNTLNLEEGDSVIIGMSPDKLLLGTFLIYLLPLLALFIFAAIGKIFLGEVISIFMGLGGLLVSLLFVKSIIVQQNVAKQFEPKLLRKVI